MDDATHEDAETVILTVTSGTGYAVGSPSGATVTISDNDLPAVSVTASRCERCRGRLQHRGLCGRENRFDHPSPDRHVRIDRDRGQRNRLFVADDLGSHSRGPALGHDHRDAEPTTASPNRPRR